MNYLFWNTNDGCSKEKNIDDWIIELIYEQKSDIVGLAEYKGDIKNIIKGLNKKGKSMYYVPQIACKRINIISKYPPLNVEHCEETSYYTIKKFPHDTLGKQIIGFVHLPSKLHKKSQDRINELSYLKGQIEGHNMKNIIVMGDFNADPFEEELVTASSMHSLSDSRNVMKGTRIVQDRMYQMYYNPMWNLFGDGDGIPGTYYYSSAESTNYFWHIFDQVVIGSELIKNFELDRLNIITSVNGKELVNKRGIPNVSDHLPITFTIK